MASIPCPPPRERDVSRRPSTLAILHVRHHRCMDIPNICRHCANIFRQVRLPLPLLWQRRVVLTQCSLLPALAFIIDMNRKTGGFYGVNEALFASALACMVFSILGAQPLTVVGITGLISLFNYTIFDIVKRYDTAIYPQVMVWVAIWTAIFHWIFAICNTCDYMRYVTDFSSESFGAYVGIIYCSKSKSCPLSDLA